MENKCTNCGSELKEGAQFCQECGDKVEYPKIESKEEIYCINCGANVTNAENFCEECGADLNAPPKQTDESFIKKYKFPIIVAVIAIILVFAGLIVMSSFNQNTGPVELPQTTVTVGAEYFKIPGQFAINADPLDIDTRDGVTSFSQSFSYNHETINIAVMSSMYDIDLESVAASQGGVHKTLMGYDGYYDDSDINHYSFAFVLDGKICLIETTSPYLFDEIEVV